MLTGNEETIPVVRNSGILHGFERSQTEEIRKLMERKTQHLLQ